MASSCPPTGAQHWICDITQWPDVNPPGVQPAGTGQIVGGAIKDASSDVLSQIAQAMASAADGILKTLSTFWMSVDTPGPSAAALVQQDTKWITTVVAVISILVAAGRLAIRRRGEPATVMLTGMARLVFVGAAATFLVTELGQLGDQFCSDLMSSPTAHLGSNGWSGVISTSAISGMIAPGAGIELIVSLLIIVSALIQLMLMILRIGLMIILTGTLPLAAAASMSDWGETWWRKHLGWLAAWLLYKPAAALLYVAAFQLTQGKHQSLVTVLAGFMLLVLSVLVLPALLRVIVPMTANLGAASGGAIAMGAAGAAATGAIRVTAARRAATGAKSAPEGDTNGPDGAGDSPGADPPRTSPPGSSERRAVPLPESTNPPGATSPDGGASSGGDNGTAPSPGNKSTRGTAIASSLAAGLSASSLRRGPDPAIETDQQNSTGQDGAPSGSDGTGDDSPPLNGRLTDDR